MANIKLKNNYWVTESIYDTTDSKTQKQVNADLHQDINDLSIAISAEATARENADSDLNGAITSLGSDDIANDSTNVSGLKVTNALDTLNSAISSLAGENKNTLTIEELSGKKVSIIGDSISTYSGYIYSGYDSYYPSNGIPSVDSVEKTWWWQYIERTGMTLEVNASYSGSCASNVRGSPYPTLADRCSTSILGNPDVIIIALGTNDSSQSAPFGEYDYTTAYAQLSEANFITAYIKGIKKLKSIYPSAKIICVALAMKFQYSFAIKKIATDLDCYFAYTGNYAFAVGLHPASNGMSQITDNVINLNPQLNGGYGVLSGDIAVSNDIDIYDDFTLGEVPQANSGKGHINWYDNAGNLYVNNRAWYAANGTMYWRIAVRNKGTGFNENNTLDIGVDGSGNKYIATNCPDVWRTALGVLATNQIYSLFVAEEVSLGSSITVNSSTNASGDVTFTKAGYYPLGIVGFRSSGSGSTSVYPARIYISSASSGSATVTYLLKSTQASDASINQRVTILWVKMS